MHKVEPAISRHYKQKVCHSPILRLSQVVYFQLCLLAPRHIATSIRPHRTGRLEVSVSKISQMCSILTVFVHETGKAVNFLYIYYSQQQYDEMYIYINGLTFCVFIFFNGLTIKVFGRQSRQTSISRFQGQVSKIRSSSEIKYQMTNRSGSELLLSESDALYDEGSGDE